MASLAATPQSDGGASRAEGTGSSDDSVLLPGKIPRSEYTDEDIKALADIREVGPAECDGWDNEYLTDDTLIRFLRARDLRIEETSN